MAVNTDSIVSNLYSTYSSQSKTGKTNKEREVLTGRGKIAPFFIHMAVDTSKNGTVDRAKLLAIENKCTRIIRIAGVTFYVAPDKDTPEHRRYLIRILESCGRRYTQKAGSYESEI